MREGMQLHYQPGLPTQSLVHWWDRMTTWFSGFREAQVVDILIQGDRVSGYTFSFHLHIPPVFPFMGPTLEWDVLYTADDKVLVAQHHELDEVEGRIRKAMPLGSWVALE